jgi:hypothetical protein
MTIVFQRFSQAWSCPDSFAAYRRKQGWMADMTFCESMRKVFW